MRLPSPCSAVDMVMRLSSWIILNGFVEILVQQLHPPMSVIHTSVGRVTTSRQIFFLYPCKYCYCSFNGFLNEVCPYENLLACCRDTNTWAGLFLVICWTFQLIQHHFFCSFSSVWCGFASTSVSNRALLQSSIAGSQKSCPALKRTRGSRWCSGRRGSPCGLIQAWWTGLRQVVTPFNVARLLICACVAQKRTGWELAEPPYPFCCWCRPFHVVGRTRCMSGLLNPPLTCGLLSGFWTCRVVQAFRSGLSPVMTTGSRLEAIFFFFFFCLLLGYSGTGFVSLGEIKLQFL